MIENNQTQEQEITPLEKAYQQAKEKGYSKDIKSFENLLKTSPQHLEKAHKQAQLKGYSKDVKEFENLLFKTNSTPTPTTEKKKPVQKGGASVGANTSSVLPKQTNKQPNFKDDLRQPDPTKNEIRAVGGGVQQLPKAKQTSEQERLLNIEKAALSHINKNISSKISQQKLANEIDDNQVIDYLREGAKKVAGAIINPIARVFTAWDKESLKGKDKKEFISTKPMIPLEEELEIAKDEFKKQGKKATPEQIKDRAKQLFIDRDMLKQKESAADDFFSNSNISEADKNKLKIKAEKDKDISNFKVREQVQMARLNNAEFEALSSEYKDIEKESKNIKSQEDLNAFNNKIALWERKKQSALKSREYLEKRFNHVIKQAEDDTEKLELFKYNYNDWDKSMSNLIGGTKRIAAGSVKLATQVGKAVEEKIGVTNPYSPLNNIMSDISDEILDEVKKDSEQYRRLEFKDVNNWSDFGQYMAQLTTEQLPIYGAMLLGGKAGLYAVSASSGGDKIKEMEDEANKQYSQTEKLFAGLGYAAGEYFPEKFGTFKMLNDFKDTYRTLSSTNRKLFADGLAKTIVTQSTKPLKEGLREGTTELITSKIQQAVDRLLLDKPMTAKQMTDQDFESFWGGFFGGAKMSAAGQLLLAPKVIRQLSDRTSIEKTQQLVAEIENLNTELLDNPNLTDQDKKVIQDKIIDLSNQSFEVIQNAHKKAKDLPKVLLSELAETNNKQYDLRQRAEAIADGNFSKEVKEKMLKELSAEFETFEKTRSNILENKGFENLSQEEKVALLDEAGRELMAEEKAKGNEEFKFEDTQIRERAIEIYDAKLKKQDAWFQKQAEENVTAETELQPEDTNQETEVDDLDFTATLDEDTETETTPVAQSENVETPTAEPIKEITDEEYLDFVENDILSDERLTEVATKVRKNKDLTPYEKRIAKGREKEISTINKKVEETEKENQRKEKVNTISQTPTLTKEEFLEYSKTETASPERLENIAYKKTNGIELSSQENLIYNENKKAIDKINKDINLKENLLDKIDDDKKQVSSNGKYTIGITENGVPELFTNDGGVAEVTPKTKQTYVLEALESRLIPEIDDLVTEINNTEIKLEGESQVGFKTFLISSYLGKIKQKSFERFGDRNYITKGIAINYFSKNGAGIDQVVTEINEQYPTMEVTEQDIIEFILEYPNGPHTALAAQKNPEYTKLIDKFEKMTGFRPTPSQILNFKRKDDQQENVLIDSEIANSQEVETLTNQLEDVELVAQYFDNWFNSLPLELQAEFYLDLQENIPNEYYQEQFKQQQEYENFEQQQNRATETSTTEALDPKRESQSDDGVGSTEQQSGLREKGGNDAKRTDSETESGVEKTETDQVADVSKKVEPTQPNKVESNKIMNIKDRFDTIINIDDIGEGFVLHRGSKEGSVEGFNSIDEESANNYGKDGVVKSSVIKKGAKILRLITGTSEQYDENQKDIDAFYEIIGNETKDDVSEWAGTSLPSDITVRLWNNKTVLERLKAAGIDIVIGQTIDGVDAFVVNENALEELSKKDKEQTQPKAERKNPSDFDIRKTTGGWAVDEKINGNWSFVAKYSSKKDAQEYVNKQTEKPTENKDQPNQLDVFSTENTTPEVKQRLEKREVSPTQATEKIEDFGEKIGGAKKDLVEKLDKTTTEDISSQPLSKSFPEPDFNQLVKDGFLTKDSALFLKFLYQNIPTKPRVKWKLNSWVRTVENGINTVKDFLNSDKAKQIDLFKTIEKTMLLQESTKRDFKTFVAIQEKVGFPEKSVSMQGYRIIEFTDGRISIVNGSSIIKDFKTFDEAVQGLADILQNKKPETSKQTKFSVYQNTETKEYFIGKKGATGVVRLFENFKSTKEAFAFLKENQDKIQETWDALKTPINERREDNRARNGNDWRNGKNIDTKTFAETFGFRGVEFGNWTNQQDRQNFINDTYDAFMDMSKALGISPKAISLGGQLAFAFGARGSGKASAHYEAGKVVINLTKKKGAGSLAHEWWHALDNFFSRNRGYKNDFVTSRPFKLNNDSTRQEVIDAFKNIVDTIKKETNLTQRSLVLDKTRSTPYWATNLEMTARTFESFIISKLAEQGYSNDFLANFRELGDWVVTTNGNIDAEKNYPYLLETEEATVHEKYQQFFDTIQERNMEDGNVVLFQLSDNQNPLRNDQFDIYSILVERLFIEKSNIKNLKEVIVDGVKFEVKKSPKGYYYLTNNEFNEVRLTEKGSVTLEYLNLAKNSSWREKELSYTEVFPKLKEEDISWDRIKKLQEKLDISEIAPLISEDDYHLATEGNFDETTTEEYDSINSEEYKSSFGSRYKIKDGVLYRKADHWGRFATVKWTLNNGNGKQIYINGRLQNKTQVGKIKITDLKRLKGQITVISDDIRFSTRQDTRPFETKNPTKATKENLQKEFPDAVVVQSESELPTPIQNKIRQQRAESKIKGVFYNGKVYMVADNIKTIGEATGTYRHETLGHKGVMEYLGDKLNTYATRIIDNAKGGQLKKLQELAARYGMSTDLNSLTDDEIELLGEEYIAMISENKSTYPKAWNDLVSFVREALRSLGINLKVTDTEIQALIGKVEKQQKAKNLANQNLSNNFVVNNTENGQKFLSLSEPKTEYSNASESDLQQKGNTNADNNNSRSVRAVWTKVKNLQFTGTTKIKNAEDVAQIMSLLENKSVEHAFAIHIDEKGNSHIQFLSIGGTTGTVVDTNLISAGVSKFKSKKVYLVHNHPSGNMQPSPADLSITKQLRDGLNPLGIEVEHIIMDTYLKEYVHINNDNLFLVKNRGENAFKQKLTPIALTEQEILSQPFGKVTDSQKAFSIIQNFRFGAMPKNALLVLDQGANVIGNYVFSNNGEITYEEIIKFVGETGIGRNVIFYGNQNNLDIINYLSGRLKNLNINVFDYIVTSSDNDTVQGYYKSMGDEGMLNEHQEKYGTGDSKFQEANNNDIRFQLGDNVEQSMPYHVAKKLVDIGKKQQNEGKTPLEIRDFLRDFLTSTNWYKNLLPLEQEIINKTNLKDIVRFGLDKKNIDETPKQTFEREKGVKSLLSRIEQGENENFELNEAVANLGLDYKVQSQKEVERRAKDFVKNVGIGNALKALRNNMIKGAERAFIYAEILDQLQDLTDNTDADKMFDLQLNYQDVLQEALNEFDSEAREAGRFISALNRVYNNSKVRYNLTKQINDFKALNNGIIDDVTLEKFKEADQQLKEIEKQLDEANKKLQEQEDQLTIKNIEEAIFREFNDKFNKSFEKKAKGFANDLRKFKIKRPGTTNISLGIDIVWDNAIEIVALSLEKTGKLADSIAEGIKYIKNSDAYKNLTKQEQQQEEDNFRKGLIDFYKEKTTTSKEKDLVSISEDGKISISNSIIKEYVASGIRDIDVIAQKIKIEFFWDNDDVTLRMIRDAITGYGKTINMSKDEIDIEVRKLKRIGKMISSLEDIDEGKRPERSGLQRDKPTAQERLMMKDIKDKMRDLPMDDAELETKWKNALETYKQRLKNRIEELNIQIVNKEKNRETREPLKLDDEAKSLKLQVAELNKVLNEIVGVPELSHEQKVKRVERYLEKQLEKLQEQIITGNIEYKRKPEPLTSDNIRNLKNQRKALNEELNKLRDEQGLVEKRQLELYKNRLKREIINYQEKLANNDFAKKEPKPLPANEEIQKLLVEKEKIKEVYDKAKYEVELKNRDFEQKAKDFAVNVANVMRVLKAGAEWSMVGIQLGILTSNFAVDIVRNPKAFIKNPVLLRAFKKLFLATASNEKYQNYINEIKAHPNYLLWKDSKLSLVEADYKLDTKEEQFIGFNLVNDIWKMTGIGLENISNKTFGVKETRTLGNRLMSLIKKDIENTKLPISEQWKNINPLQAFERGNVAYANELRIALFEQGVRKLRLEGKNESENIEDFKTLAKMVNTFSGRATLPFGMDRFNDAFSIIFFSAKMTYSVFQQMNPGFYLYGLKNQTEGETFKPSVAQKLALKQMMTFVTTTIGGMYLLQALAGTDDEDEEDKIQIETDPRHTDFMQMRVRGKDENDIRFDPWHGMRTQVVFFARLFDGHKINNKGELVHIRSSKYDSHWDSFMQTYMINKFSPTMQMVYFNMASKTDPKDGENKLYDKTFLETVKPYPLYYEALMEVSKEDPDAFTSFMAALGVFGLNNGVYAKSEKSPITFEQQKENILIKKKEDNLRQEFKDLAEQVIAGEVSQAEANQFIKQYEDSPNIKGYVSSYKTIIRNNEINKGVPMIIQQIKKESSPGARANMIKNIWGDIYSEDNKDVLKKLQNAKVINAATERYLKQKDVAE